MRVWTDAGIRGAFGSATNHELFFHFIYLTSDAPSSAMPGPAV